MSTRHDTAELLKLNPQVRPDDLAASREMLRKLRGNGLRGRKYQLAIPFSGRHAPIWMPYSGSSCDPAQAAPKGTR